MLNIGDNRNFERLSGTAYFQPLGQAGMFCLGNIVMHKLDPKIERKDIMRYQGGSKRLARTDVLGVNPEYQIDADEFNSLNLPLVIWGQRVADTTQVATGNLVATITNALPGMTYPLGGYVDVTVVSVTPTTQGAAALIEGADYAVDAMKGLLTILTPGAVPATGTMSLLVAFSAAGLNRETYVPFSNLQQRGTLALYENDSPEDVNLPLNSITFPVTIYCDSAGDTKVEDNRKATLRARITGRGRILRRQDDASLMQQQ